MTRTDWPIDFDGIVETVTTTHQPDGSWAVAALGIQQRDGDIVARTWGETRTKRNLSRTGVGFVQLIPDAVIFTRAALERWSREEAIFPEAAAWIEIEATPIDSGSEAGTDWVDWSLQPTDHEVRRQSVPLPGRGLAAVIEMTVTASRLDVPAYADEPLRERLQYFAEVATRCGGPTERDAVDRIERIVENDQPTPANGTGDHQ